MLILRCELAPHGRLADVRVQGARIAAVAAAGGELAPLRGETCLDAGGAALLPGLHDHHLHLLALGAALDSTRCGPPDVNDPAEFAARLREAAAERPRGAWIRAVGYHDSVAGPLDRTKLDALVPDHPLRLQHRSGALWMLNGAALRAIGAPALDRAGDAAERDDAGEPTGRFFRADAWLRAHLPERPGAAMAALDRVGAQLAALGVCGVTDASPDNGPDELALFARAATDGALPQSVRVMGSDALPSVTTPALASGERKWILDEEHLPDWEQFCESIRRTHAAARAVAVHCVTRAELVFALAAFDAVGARAGDRIEHAAVAPPECLSPLVRLGLRVVTQPNFLYERGDRYAQEVDTRDQPWLYRCRGFDDAGVPLAGGTDAPFGEPDPWAAMRAAVERASRGGHRFASAERVAPERALALFTAPLETPGSAARRIAAGVPADLVLLDRPWRAMRRDWDGRAVRATWCRGRLAAGELR